MREACLEAYIYCEILYFLEATSRQKQYSNENLTVERERQEEQEQEIKEWDSYGSEIFSQLCHNK